MFEQEKYAPVYTLKHKLIALFQFIGLNTFIVLFLTSFADLHISSQVAYGILIFTTIFGFTSIMDGHKWAFVFEITRSLLGLMIMFHPFQGRVWEVDYAFALGTSAYFFLSLCATLWMYQSLPKHKPITS